MAGSSIDSAFLHSIHSIHCLCILRRHASLALLCKWSANARLDSAPACGPPPEWLISRPLALHRRGSSPLSRPDSKPRIQYGSIILYPAHTVLRSAITLTMLPGPTISTNYIPTSAQSLKHNHHEKLHSTYLLMPTKQHTHPLPPTLSASKTPPPNLTKPRTLRRNIPRTRRIRRCSSRRRRTLRHTFIQILHQRIADLAPAIGLVHSLQDGRHFGLPDILQNLGYC